MKILIFSWRDIKHPWAGGSEVNIHEMSKIWIKDGHEVTMLCACHYGNGISSNREIIDGINVIRIGGRYLVYILAPLYYLFRLKGMYDIIIDIENGIPFFTPLFIKRPKVCLVHHVHKKVFFIEMPFPLNWLGYLLETKIMPVVYKNVKFVSVSKTTKDALILIGVKSNISVVYNGLNHNVYKSGNTKFDSPTIIYLGRLRKYKKINVLIDCVPQIVEKVTDMKLLIVGTGDDQYNLEYIIKDRGLKKHIKMLGFVPEKKKIELLQKSWVYATPTKIEGWGLAILEANACGTPAVAFNAPGVREAIINNLSGFLVESKNQMIHRLVDILSNSQLRQELEKGAIARASEFSWEKSSKAFLNILYSEK